MSEQTQLPGLLADGPSDVIPPKHRIYAPLIGDWEFEGESFQPDGSVFRACGEWYFRWALDGRAVQDVWICPQRSQQQGRPGEEWGTTVRYFDLPSQEWKVFWVGPRMSWVQTLVARSDETGIIHEGTNAEGRRVQWIMSDIKERSFTWRSLVAAAAGSWALLGEMRVTRR